jgi:hypothetical protein
MLGKPSRRTEKRLQEHGVKATAVVLEIAGQGMSVTSGTGNLVGNTDVMLKAKLRVEPEGRPAFEVEQRFRFPQMGVPYPGLRVPVIFDPDDTDTVMLDDSPQAQIQSAMQGAGLSQDSIAKVQSIAAAAMGGASRDQLQQMASASFQPMPMQAPAAAEDTRLDQLERLASLHDRGVLTDAEFAAQKAQVLGAQVS